MSAKKPPSVNPDGEILCLSCSRKAKSPVYLSWNRFSNNSLDKFATRNANGTKTGGLNCMDCLKKGSDAAIRREKGSEQAQGKREIGTLYRMFDLALSQHCRA